MRVIRSQKQIMPPFSLFTSELKGELSRPERLLWTLLPFWLAEGLSFFLRRNRYDAVITEDYRTALVFGLLSRLLSRRAIHIVKELYLDEAALESQFAGRVFRTCLKRADCVITNCSAEIQTLSLFLDLPTERFRFLPWPSNLTCIEEGEDCGYVFAAGRSFRDWETLIQIAGDHDVPFVVVAEARAVAGLPKPGNMTIHCEIPRAQYLDLLRGASIVVIPLKSTVRSIGQAAVLEAMSLSKPIITARTPGTRDYIRDGQDGLFYEPGDRRDMSDKIGKLLADPAERLRLSRGAAESVGREFSKSRYSHRMVQLVRELLDSRIHGDPHNRAAGLRTH